MQLTGRSVELLLSLFMAWGFGHVCYYCLKSAPESSQLFLKFLRDSFLHIDIILELPSVSCLWISLLTCSTISGNCSENNWKMLSKQFSQSCDTEKSMSTLNFGCWEHVMVGRVVKVVAWFSEECVAWLQSHVREASLHKTVHMMRTVIFISPQGESSALNVKLL